MRYTVEQIRSIAGGTAGLAPAAAFEGPRMPGGKTIPR